MEMCPEAYGMLINPLAQCKIIFKKGLLKDVQQLGGYFVLKLQEKK